MGFMLFFSLSLCTHVYHDLRFFTVNYLPTSLPPHLPTSLSACSAETVPLRLLPLLFRSVLLQMSCVVLIVWLLTCCFCRRSGTVHARASGMRFGFTFCRRREELLRSVVGSFRSVVLDLGPTTFSSADSCPSSFGQCVVRDEIFFL